MILLMVGLVKHLFSPSLLSFLFMTCTLIFLFSDYLVADIGQRAQGTIIYKSVSNNFVFQNMWFYFLFYLLLSYPLFFTANFFNKNSNENIELFSLNGNLRTYLNFFFILNFLIFLFILFTANLNIIFNAEFYSQITTPEEIGINPLIFNLIIFFQIFVGFILGLYMKDLGSVKYIHFLIFFLITLIPLSGYTRLGLLPIAAFFLSSLVSSKSNFESIIKLFSYSIIFFILYLIVMLFRGDQALWSEPPGFGFIGFFRALLLFNELVAFVIDNGDTYGSIFEIIFGNIFNGSAIFFESISQGDIKYTSSFELQSILSISSQLDNFNELYLPVQERINFFIPMNTIGELYFFSLPILFLAFLIIIFSIFFTQRMYYSLPLPIAVIASSPMYLFIFYSSQYSTRQSFKYLVLELFIIFLWIIYSKIKSKSFT